MHSSHQKHLAIDRGSLVEQDVLLSPVGNVLSSMLEIFEDGKNTVFSPLLGFHFFQFSKAHNSEISELNRLETSVFNKQFSFASRLG